MRVTLDSDGSLTVVFESAEDLALHLDALRRTADAGKLTYSVRAPDLVPHSCGPVGTAPTRFSTLGPVKFGQSWPWSGNPLGS